MWMFLNVSAKTLYIISSGWMELLYKPSYVISITPSSLFFCHSSGSMLFLFRGFITQTTTTSSLSSYLVLLCWRNLQEHSWALTSVEGRLHSWESLSLRLVCEKSQFSKCISGVLISVCVPLQVVPDSDAHRAGLQEGDQVLSVNDVDFQDIEHSKVSQSTLV